MKADVNDTLRTEGVDAVRARHDKASKFNSGTTVRPPEYSDDALALRFAEHHRNELRYVHKWS
jgi:hypothetical protein